MAREDFDELSKLMHPTNGHRDSTLPRVDRIILYIDDLDRCYPPTKVVRVLEAAHLLLAFPLFVVFVGVDSRWVSRSLNRHYDEMLRDEALQDDDLGPSSAQAPANSQDFLEKIFQVPFWLRRMDPKAVRNMLDGLITSDERDDHQLGVDEPPEGEQAPAPGPRPDAATDDEPPEVIRSGAQPAADDDNEVDEPFSEPAATATEALRIRKVERDFMDEVAPLMPRSPRAVKRFVNIYRLYKAALAPSDLDKFLDRDGHPGNFRAVQVLLALVIGTPDLAKAVVEVLGTPEESRAELLSDLSAQLPESKDPTWKTTREALKTFAEKDSNNLTLELLCKVAPMVTRYSLHHMVSAPPDDSTL
jgi:KAP family P-loop domain